MRYRFLATMALGVLASGCVVQPAADSWSSQVLLGTTPLGDAYADFLSARYAGMVNDPEAAATYYTNAWERSGADSDLLDRAAVSLLLAGSPTEAAQIAKSADEKVLEGAPFAILALAADEIGAGRARRALRLLEKSELGAMQGIGRALQVWSLADRDSDSAVAMLERSAETGRLAAPYDDCLRGLILASAGEDEQALEAFDEGFGVCSRIPVLAAAHLAVANAAKGREHAMDVLDRLPADIRDSLEVRATARPLQRGDDIPPPRLKTAEGAALGMYIAASAVGADTSGQLGAVFFQMMHAIDPSSDLALVMLADAHFSLERYAVANEYAAQVDKDSVYAPRAHWEQARSLIADKQDAQALEALRGLAGVNLNRDLALRVGDAFRLLDAPMEAEAVYTRLIEIEAGEEPDWRPLLGRAAALNEREQWDAAEADLLAALEIDPDQPEVLNFLGYGWIDKGRNVEAGFDLIRRAIAQRPRSGYIIDSLGWAHYRMGQFEDAARELERAAELAPDDAEIISHLGDAYWRTGRRLEAGFEWRRALTLDPDAELSGSLREKLERGLPDDIAEGMAEATPAQP